MSHNVRKRRGFSLLEITIASILAAVVVLMASGVSIDISRHMAANIAEAQVAAEARLAIESFRRDLGGSDLDGNLGDRSEGRLVARMIPSTNELRLCFDANQDASADWVAPDRVVTYTVDQGNLIRSDQLSGTSFTVARHIDSVEFIANSGQIDIIIDFEFGGFSESYAFATSDVL